MASPGPAQTGNRQHASLGYGGVISIWLRSILKCQHGRAVREGSLYFGSQSEAVMLAGSGRALRRAGRISVRSASVNKMPAAYLVRLDRSLQRPNKVPTEAPLPRFEDRWRKRDPPARAAAGVRSIARISAWQARSRRRLSLRHFGRDKLWKLPEQCRHFAFGPIQAGVRARWHPPSQACISPPREGSFRTGCVRTSFPGLQCCPFSSSRFCSFAGSQGGPHVERDRLKINFDYGLAVTMS